MAKKEYIEREAALTYARKAWSKGLNVIEYLKEVPAADVRPVVRGRWINSKGSPVPWDDLNKNCPRYSAYCSACGEWLTASDEYPVIGNYCPNCGADMRGEQNE